MPTNQWRMQQLVTHPLPPGGRDDPSSHFLSLSCPPFPVEATPLNPAMGERCRPPCRPGRQTRILCTLTKNARDCNNSPNTYKLNYSYSDWRHFSRVKNFCIPVGDAFPHLPLYGPEEMRGMHPHRRTARVWIRRWPVVLCLPFSSLIYYAIHSVCRQQLQNWQHAKWPLKFRQRLITGPSL